MSKKVNKSTNVNTEVEITNVNTEQIVTRGPLYDKIYEDKAFILEQYENACLYSYTHGDLMDILRYIERKVGHSIPLDTSCSSCVMDLLRLFKNFKIAL